MSRSTHQRVESLLQRVIALLRVIGPQWAERRIGIEFAGCVCGCSFEPKDSFLEAPIMVCGESKGFVRIDSSPENPSSGETEVAALAQLIETVLELDPGPLELYREDLRQSNKMSQLATLIPGVSHDINNPISTATLSAENLAAAWKTLGPVLEAYAADRGMFHVGHMPFNAFNEMVPGLISGVLSSLRKIHDLTDELRRYIESRPHRRLDTLDVNAVVRSSLALLAGKLKKLTYRVHVVYGANLPSVQGDYQALEQAIINLIDHAYQSLPGKQKSIHISTAYESKPSSIVIALGNETAAFTEARPFNPFGQLCPKRADVDAFSHGLAIAADIIESHGGRLEFVSDAGQGTAARIILPAHIAPTASLPDSHFGTLLNSR